MIDVEKVRADTPGVRSVVHFNNAGSALPPTAVTNAVIDYLKAEAIGGGYEAAASRADDLASVYDAASSMLGGDPRNWAFVESATRAWNAAFSALRFSPGDRVITTRAEYPSNMAGLLRAKEIQGIEIDIAPNDKHGQLDVAALKTMLDDRTRVVSLTHIPTQGGLVNPASEVGELLRDSSILYQVDACQSVGQLEVNVDDIGCDMLSFTGRKFVRGPRSTGMVWASDKALSQMGNPAGVDMSGSDWVAPLEIIPHPKASRFEPYETFFAGKVGLAVALRYAKDIGIANIAERNSMLANTLRSKLSGLPRVSVHDLGVKKSAIVTFKVEGYDADQIMSKLGSRSINVSTSVTNSARLDFPERGLTELVRASVHYYNNEEEIDKFIDEISKLL